MVKTYLKGTLMPYYTHSQIEFNTIQILKIKSNLDIIPNSMNFRCYNRYTICHNFKSNAKETMNFSKKYQ